MSSHIALRVARPDERLALEELQRRASLVWEDYREALLAHPEAIELPPAQLEAGQVTVAETDGRVLGFSVVLPREDGAAELDGLFVEPEGWGKGVGRGLVADAAARARAAGVRVLHVIANPRAEGFYARCGFERIGETPTRFGPALLMRMTL
ncbi:GNAT family N-acetyltransferase [Hyalangium rubrum]|uniref:GNAT family N-acetyltransferase n=1 Tax=Hyalangium rubrum TaxID=3103134 RepID=A0ABU5HEE3_9BACT|nr:GNAT family N-acetyltransferase [Hyalangium sp. s54d21]MDY7231844.1 GNAT family N-acetyltransferase [Hyalangium sp. s54d21]